MSTINDGGQVCPIQTGNRQVSEYEWESDNTPGMSLRDHFAGLAIDCVWTSMDDSMTAAQAADFTAKVCYEIADSMLRARGAA